MTVKTTKTTSTVKSSAPNAAAAAAAARLLSGNSGKANVKSGVGNQIGKNPNTGSMPNAAGAKAAKIASQPKTTSTLKSASGKGDLNPPQTFSERINRMATTEFGKNDTQASRTIPSTVITKGTHPQVNTGGLDAFKQLNALTAPFKQTTTNIVAGDPVAQFGRLDHPSLATTIAGGRRTGRDTITANGEISSLAAPDTGLATLGRALSMGALPKDTSRVAQVASPKDVGFPDVNYALKTALQSKRDNQFTPAYGDKYQRPITVADVPPVPTRGSTMIGPNGPSPNFNVVGKQQSPLFDLKAEGISPQYNPLTSVDTNRQMAQGAALQREIDAANIVPTTGGADRNPLAGRYGSSLMDRIKSAVNDVRAKALSPGTAAPVTPSVAGAEQRTPYNTEVQPPAPVAKLTSLGYDVARPIDNTLRPIGDAIDRALGGSGNAQGMSYSEQQQQEQATRNQSSKIGTSSQASTAMSEAEIAQYQTLNSVEKSTLDSYIKSGMTFAQAWAKLKGTGVSPNPPNPPNWNQPQFGPTPLANMQNAPVEIVQTLTPIMQAIKAHLFG